jgi:hypothetical protein
VVSQHIVNLLVSRILSGAINPKTNVPFKLDDILIPDYKVEVKASLAV